MGKAITVQGQKLPIRQLNGQRVVTLSDVAAVHGVKRGRVEFNYNYNRKRFVEGEDYYRLKGKSAHRISGCPPNVTNINVFTESGYLMLVKSLTDDTAWAVQRELVRRYFGSRRSDETREINPPLSPLSRGAREIGVDLKALMRVMKPDYRKLLFYRVEKELTQKETAAILGVCVETIKRYERDLKALGAPIPNLNGQRTIAWGGGNA